MSNFHKYSAFYDLLYRDKDYAAEAAYVARTIRSVIPGARKIVELGSGTGRHGRLLAEMGFHVHGIERSLEMVSIARMGDRSRSSETSGSFTCEVGDICTAKLDRTFDAAISLFHVISYQTSDRALHAAFQRAMDHLIPGGVFLFDVWHAPAVLCQPVAVRIKEVSNERYHVRRLARPEFNKRTSTVNVVYDFTCEDFDTGKRYRFTEEHLMRYLMPEEVYALAQQFNFSRIAEEEFLTRRPPSADTWSVTYVLRKNHSVD